MRTLPMAALGLCSLLVSSASLSGCGDGSTDYGPTRVEDTSETQTDLSATSLKDGLVATWELVRVELRDPARGVLPAPEPPAFGSAGAIGQAVLDDAGRIGVAIMQQGRTKGGQLSPKEALADLEGYTAFFGTYTVNEADGLIAVHFEGHRDPRLTGMRETYTAALVGEELTVSRNSGRGDVQSISVWRRVPELADLTPVHRRVIGFWRHVPNDGNTVDEPTLRPGFIIYTSAGRMMVHLMDPQRSVYEGDRPTPEEAQATVGSYTSYFGPFSVNEDGGYFVHHRIGHTVDLTDRPMPERRTGTETDAQRFFEFVDNRMVLRFLSTAGIQPPPSPGGPPFRGMITWERFAPRAQ